MKGDRGSALVIGVMSVALLSALALALALVTSTEMTIAASYATGCELMYVAEAGVEIAEQELRFAPDWNLVLAGASLSAWVDGDPAQLRFLEDGTPLILGEATSVANCGKKTTCSVSEMDAISDVRPWGSNNPRWRLFAFGPLNRGYVVAWIGDDAAETDGDPLHDGSTASNPGTGVVAVRAEAFGVGGGHKTVEATVRRTSGAAGIARLSWAQIR